MPLSIGRKYLVGPVFYISKAGGNIENIKTGVRWLIPPERSQREGIPPLCIGSMYLVGPVIHISEAHGNIGNSISVDRSLRGP